MAQPFANDREELDALRRLAELEAKAGTPSTPAPVVAQAPVPQASVAQQPHWQQEQGLPSDRRPANIKAAAEAGIITDSPTPSGVTPGKAWMADNEGLWNDYLNKQVEDHFMKQNGLPGGKVRKGEISKQYEYWDPTDSNWHVLNNTRIGQQALENAPVALGIGAGLGALALPEMGIAGTLASVFGLESASGTLVDLMGKKAGDIEGINKDGLTGDRLGSSVNTGLTQGAISTGMAALAPIAGVVKRTFKGANPFTPQEAAALLDISPEYAKTVRELGIENPLAFQVVGKENPAAGTAQQLYDYARAHADPKLRTKIVDQAQGVESGLRKFYENLDDTIPQATPPGGVPGQGFVNQVKAGMDGDVAGARKAFEQAKQDSYGLNARLPDSSVIQGEEASKALRSAAERLANAASVAKSTEYQKVSDALGYNPATGLAKHSIVLDAGSEAAKLVRTYGANTTTGTLKGVEDYGTGQIKVNLATLKDAKDRVSAAFGDKTAGGSAVTTNTKDLVEASKGLKDIYDEALQTLESRGDIPKGTYATKIKADALNEEYQEAFKTGFISKFLKETKQGTWVIADQQAFKNVVASKDMTALRQLHDMVKNDPAAMREVKDFLYSLYKDNTFKDGLSSGLLHRKFMQPGDKGYGDVMDLFFANKDKAKMSSWEDISSSLLQTANELKNSTRVARIKFGGRITRWSPEQLVTNIANGNLRDGEAASIVKLSNSFGQNTMDEIRDGVARRIRTKLYPDGPQGKPNWQGIGTLLDKEVGSLTEIMGANYVTGLRQLRDATPILFRESAGVASPSSSSFFQRSVRQAEPQFGAVGRATKWLDMLRGDRAPANIWKALTEPEELRRIANSARNQSNRMKSMGALGGAAGSQVNEEDYRD